MMLQRVKIAESDKKHIYEKIMMTKAIFNTRMGVVVIVSLIFFLFELIVNQHLLVIHNTMGQAQDTQSMVVNLFALSIYTLILGILPGIPYGFSLLEEKQSGYLRFKLLRMSPKRYIKNKMLCVAVTGACSVIMPYIIIVAVLLRYGETTTSQRHMQVLETLVWGKVMYVWNGNFVIFLKGVLLLLFGVFWAEITLLITLFVHNKYIAFVLPYVIYEILFFLGKNNVLSLINPRFMIRYDQSIERPLWLPFVCFAIYIFVVLLLNYYIFKRQVKNDKY